MNFFSRFLQQTGSRKIRPIKFKQIRVLVIIPWTVLLHHDIFIEIPCEKFEWTFRNDATQLRK